MPENNWFENIDKQFYGDGIYKNMQYALSLNESNSRNSSVVLAASADHKFNISQPKRLRQHSVHLSSKILKNVTRADGLFFSLYCFSRFQSCWCMVGLCILSFMNVYGVKTVAIQWTRISNANMTKPTGNPLF